MKFSKLFFAITFATLVMSSTVYAECVEKRALIKLDNLGLKGIGILINRDEVKTGEVTVNNDVNTAEKSFTTFGKEDNKPLYYRNTTFWSSLQNITATEYKYYFYIMTSAINKDSILKEVYVTYKFNKDAAKPTDATEVQVFTPSEDKEMVIKEIITGEGCI